MGIVDYCASTVLAATGLALAAPFLEAKVPAAAPLTQMLRQHRKIAGVVGMIGGAAGLLLIPLLLLVVLGLGGLTQNLLTLFVATLELLGCAGAVALGFMVIRGGEEGPHSGALDLRTTVGFAGFAYGGFLVLLFTAVQIIT